MKNVLEKHGATSRLGISLLHSHFHMSEDEILLEETDVVNRKQTISVIKKANVPAGAIYMDRRFDNVDKNQVISLYKKISEYHNQLVVNKLQVELSLSVEDASFLFDDVLRFMALCTNSPRPIAPPRAIDQGWHQFILLTKDYAHFCDSFFGHYVHHQPADPFSDAINYSAERNITRNLAESVFGTLSTNWNEPSEGGGCTHNCGTGDINNIETVANAVC